MSEEAAIAWCPFPGEEEAEQVARKVIEEGLAACANIVPAVRSIFRYEGKVEEAREVGVLFKTTASRLDRLVARVVALHPYDLPAIAGWRADAATPEVLAWLAETVRAG